MEEYLSIKEKTVSDTLSFTPDYCATVNSIKETFENGELNELLDDETVRETVRIMEKYEHYNFRSLIFAFQKFVDLTAKLENFDLDKELKRELYFDCIKISFRIKMGRKAELDMNDAIRNATYIPVYNICKQFIDNGVFDGEGAKNSFDSILEERKLSGGKSDEDYQVIISYKLHDEKTVLESIKNIAVKISKDAFGYNLYITLMRHLITIHGILDFDLQKIKDNMLKNIRKAKVYIPDDYIEIGYLQNKLNKSELEVFVEDYLAALSENANYKKRNFVASNADTLDGLSCFICDNKDKLIARRNVFHGLNADKIIALIKTASSVDIIKFNQALQIVFGFANANTHFDQDMPVLKDLSDKLSALTPTWKFDKIKIYNIRELQSAVEKLYKKY